MERIFIPAFSDSRHFGTKINNEELKENHSSIFTKDKEKIKTILISMKEHFPNAINMINIIDTLLCNKEIFDKCILNKMCDSGIYSNLSITLCPLRDKEQSEIEFDISSVLYPLYGSWSVYNSGKSLFDFIKENDVENIFITINDNTDTRVKTVMGTKGDVDYIIRSTYEEDEKYDPEYKEILFMRSLFQ